MLCTGKVYYDLLEAREKTERDDVYLLRVEQLYPFPADIVADYAAQFPHLEDVVWAQEEPMNAGAWTFIAPLIEAALGKRPTMPGARAAAATATGLLKRHNAEQAKLVAEALGRQPRRSHRRHSWRPQEQQGSITWQPMSSSRRWGNRSPKRPLASG